MTRRTSGSAQERWRRCAWLTPRWGRPLRGPPRSRRAAGWSPSASPACLQTCSTSPGALTARPTRRMLTRVQTQGLLWLGMLPMMACTPQRLRQAPTGPGALSPIRLQSLTWLLLRRRRACTPLLRACGGRGARLAGFCAALDPAELHALRLELARPLAQAVRSLREARTAASMPEVRALEPVPGPCGYDVVEKGIQAALNWPKGMCITCAKCMFCSKRRARRWV